MNATTSKQLTTEEILKKYGGRLMSPEEAARAKSSSKQIILSKKYRNGLKSVVGIHLYKLHLTHPDMPLSLVIATMLQDINPELPAEVLLEITAFIIEEWEKIKQEDPSFKIEEELALA
ncbi:MAG: hypothetical protein AAB316_14655 [Bacteroidota bacterium]